MEPSRPEAPDPGDARAGRAPDGQVPTPASSAGASAAASGLVALALGLGLVRFFRLGHWSLWYDEVLTWADAHHGVLEGGQYNPLGYRAIRLVVELLGGVPSEFSLRLLPALCGWMAIALTAWAFSPLIGRRGAAWAALLVAVSSWEVYWSQNARFYTLAQMVGLLGAGLVVRGFLRGGSVRVIGGALLVAAGALLQLQSALLLAALLVAPLLVRALALDLPEAGARGRRTFRLLVLLALVAGSPWTWSVFSTYAASKGMDGGLGVRLGSVAHFLLTTGRYVTPLLGVGFLYGAWTIVRRRDGTAALALAVVLAGCTAAGIAALGATVSAQYVFVFLPWIAAVACAPLNEAYTWGSGVGSGPEGSRARAPRRMTSVYGLLLLVPALVDVGLYLTLRQGERERWREAWELVLAERRPGELVAGMAAPIGEFYLDPTATDLRHPRTVAWLDKYRAGLPSAWRAFDRRQWLVFRPDSLATWEDADRASFERLLRHEGRLVRRFDVDAPGRDLAVEVWVRE